MKKKDVFWITNVPSPYRVDFFNELGKTTNLKVLFERKSSSERDKSWENFHFSNFKGFLMNGFKIGVDKTFSFKIIKYLKEYKHDKIVISNYSSPSEIIAALYLIIKRRKYVIETDGGFSKNNKGIKEKIKTFIISHADKCFSTSRENDKYFLHYGAKIESIVRYPFTSLYAKDIISHSLSNSERLKLKEKYNIKEDKVILSIGRFIYGKGFDVLFNSLI